MNTTTGHALADLSYVAQSMRDILTTPIGLCVMQRDYGGQVLDLIDQLQNPAIRPRMNGKKFTIA
ncbi:hypothetical protein C2I33_10045 [Ralstonia solanacearum]|uniref:hypothetical protein n=1 Tax=Ralstonia solanacearum TaxID=305 RepID=UPI0001816813|nr:hypothetical protein [Ralstonia solanacearum]MDC6175966.1 hypothetical protein [Ralstonia solanacearum]MDC6208775.1 hypothetical protein [Ralstonia solanacearum]MDC6239500.1 hypothetical protein [Ralstonia solanacearum]MDD7799381.1 hypothetical protein [Ralstonia solanacearum]TYZ55084.1 hypothetical protein C2I33_10045 [Ralstonia solanacearum]